MSCGCGSPLFGGKCCGGSGGGGGGIPSALPANIDLSALSMYNYEFYGAVQGNTALNTAAMQAMFTVVAAANPVGGACFFKQGNYPINPITDGYIVPPQTRLYAESNQAGPTINLANGQQLLALNGDGVLFKTTSTNHTTGGQYFDHLCMAVGPVAATDPGTTAINADGGWGVRAYKCGFGNFPKVLRAQTLSSGLDQCLIVYNTGPNGDGPGGSQGGSAHVGLVRLGAAECYAIGPGEYLQKSVNSGGPTGVVCISIEDGADSCIVGNMHISDFDYGISYGLNNTHIVKHNKFVNLKVDSYSSAVWMEPSGAGGVIVDEKYIGCQLAITSGSTATKPAVYIGTNGQLNPATDNISYIDCDVYGSDVDGYQLMNGDNLSITGGMACGNGPSGGAGVAVIGAFGKIDINGTNMTPNFIGALTLQNQQYAMRFAASAAYADICTVRGANWTGYPTFTGPNTGPLFVGAGGIAAGGRVYINLTKGYNDAGATVNATLPTTGSPLTAASFGYFGPSRASAAGVTSYILNGTTYAVAAGTFNLVVQPYDTFGVAGTPTSVVWKGIWG